MNDDELEARLARWRPAAPPADLRLRLLAAEPPGRRALRSWPGAWSLAYAGLLTAWTVILAFWILTPDRSSPAPSVPTGRFTLQSDAPSLAGTLGAERRLFLSRTYPDQL